MGNGGLVIQTLKKTAIFVGIILACATLSPEMRAERYTSNTKKSRRVYKSRPVYRRSHLRYHRTSPTVSVGPENWQAWDGADYDPYWNPVTYGCPC